MIHPGDRVDISVHLQRNPSIGIPKTEVRLVLQDIKVFAVNDVWEMDPEGEGQAIKAQTISLLVTPTQAQKVILAEELGKIRLVMRSPGDTAESKLAAVTVAGLFEESELGDRDADSPSPEPTLSPSDGGTSAFLEFLASQQQPNASNPPAGGPSQVWKMRAIEGDEVRDVVLALDHQISPPQAASPPPSSGFSFWKLISEAARSTPGSMEHKAPSDEGAVDEDEPDEEEAEANEPGEAAEEGDENEASGESDAASEEDAEDGLAAWSRARTPAGAGRKRVQGIGRVIAE